MKWLLTHRTILPLADFVARHRDDKLRRRAVAITFDDGYACNAEIAVPVLERMGIAATIFLPVELIKQGRDFWWHELERIVLDHPATTLHHDGTEFDLGEKSSTDRNWAPHTPARTPRQVAYLALWARLYATPTAALDGAMEQLRAQFGPVERPSVEARPMTPDQVRGLVTTKIVFGSHSLTHPSLPALSSDEKSREVAQSAIDCERLTGSRPLTFAYPFGDFDEECETLVQAAGFTCACTVVQRPVGRGSCAFALPRIQAGNWPIGRFSGMLGGQ